MKNKFSSTSEASQACGRIEYLLKLRRKADGLQSCEMRHKDFVERCKMKRF